MGGLFREIELPSKRVHLLTLGKERKVFLHGGMVVGFVFLRNP